MQCQRTAMTDVAWAALARISFLRQMRPEFAKYYGVTPPCPRPPVTLQKFLAPPVLCSTPASVSHHHHHHYLSHTQKHACIQTIDYKATSNADNNPEINVT